MRLCTLPSCLLALLLGVAKEAFNVGEIGRDLEIIHSSVETFVALIQVSNRKNSKELKMKELQCF